LDLGSATFLPVTIHDGFDSFPSGHVAGAIIITFLLAIYVPRSQWFLAPLVAVVAVARIVQGRHFPSDVLAGGAIALLSLVFIVTWLGPRYFAPIDWAPIRQAFARRPNLAPQPD
jgi:undecaprenyl-diphosphatase